MPKDIYLDDEWHTEYDTTNDTRTVSGDPQRGQQVATIAWGVVKPQLGGAMDAGTIVGLQGNIRDALLRADAVGTVSSVRVTERTRERVEFLISTDVADVTVPIEMNRP